MLVWQKTTVTYSPPPPPLFKSVRVCENHANYFTPYGTFSDLMTDLDIEQKKKKGHYTATRDGGIKKSTNLKALRTQNWSSNFQTWERVDSVWVCEVMRGYVPSGGGGGGGELSDSQRFVAQSASGDTPVGQLWLNLKGRTGLWFLCILNKRM